MQPLKEPIALVEVQGYTYAAYMAAAEAFKNCGEKEFTQHLLEKAGDLKKSFNRDFWMTEEGFFAYALDADNNQEREITSNIGHLLVTGIIADDKLPKVVSRLMQPDMLTKYGIRTLSLYSANFSDREPSAYHNGGGIWPHDNALIYLGLIKSGFHKEAQIVRDAVLEAQYELLRKYGLHDLEVYMVDRNGRLRPYRTAQQPQGWASEGNMLLTEIAPNIRDF